MNDTTLAPARASRRPRCRAAAAHKMSMRDARLLLRQVPGAEGRRPRHRGTARHRVHRPVGLRQVDAAAHAQPHVLAVPGPARDGRDPVQRPATSSTPASTSTCCAPRSAWCSRSRRRSRCRSTTTSRSACGCTRTSATRDMDERVEWALTKAAMWDEAKDKLKQSGHGAFGRPAAAAVHRARGRRQARRAAARRADLRARPDLDRQDRGADHASSSTTTRSPSSRTTCSRRRGCPTTPPTCTWASSSSSARPTRSSSSRKRKETEDYITGRFG